MKTNENTPDENTPSNAFERFLEEARMHRKDGKCSGYMKETNFHLCEESGGDYGSRYGGKELIG